MIVHPTFKPGDKVEIIEGGWGIHPAHVGKIVTIHSMTDTGRYTTEETLTALGVHTVHHARCNAAAGSSFRLVEPINKAGAIIEQIMELNKQIRTLRDNKQALILELNSEFKE